MEKRINRIQPLCPIRPKPHSTHFCLELETKAQFKSRSDLTGAPWPRDGIGCFKGICLLTKSLAACFGKQRPSGRISLGD